MPRACPVEPHARCYQTRRATTFDATGLSRGASRSPLPNSPSDHLRSHGLVPWNFTLAATKLAERPPSMPRACPVELHARCYQTRRATTFDATGLSRGTSRSLLPNSPSDHLRCHGLVPWNFTLAATKLAERPPSMPRACPVELHARCYQTRRATTFDATGLSRGTSRSLLPNSPSDHLRCHGLVPWNFTLAATK